LQEIIFYIVFAGDSDTDRRIYGKADFTAIFLGNGSNLSCLRYVPIARGRHAATLIRTKIYFFDSKEDLKETKFF
jgi:hypothetical protein